MSLRSSPHNLPCGRFAENCMRARNRVLGSDQAGFSRESIRLAAPWPKLPVAKSSLDQDPSQPVIREI